VFTDKLLVIKTVATVFTLLLLLLFYYCHYYKTVATDKLLRSSLFPGTAELTTHVLRLINILWLPLCRINKFGVYFPRRLLRSPTLVGHQGGVALAAVRAAIATISRARLVRSGLARSTS
jgi:hypothetical protein